MSLYKIVFLALLTLSFLYKLFLHVRTYRSRHNPIPENVADVYDTDAYLHWKNYSAESTRLAAWSDAAKFAVLFLLLALNVFALTDGIANDFWAAICVTLIALAASALVDAPFQYYGNMNIEERYGFNRYTKKLFWQDQIKGSSSMPCSPPLSSASSCFASGFSETGCRWPLSPRGCCSSSSPCFSAPCSCASSSRCGPWRRASCATS